MSWISLYNLSNENKNTAQATVDVITLFKLTLIK